MSHEKISFSKIPLSEMLKSIPGIFGIRLEEEPKYEVLHSDVDFEIRRYEPILTATVTVKGEREKALDEGFDKLAGYIFGGNSAETDIAMTSPVFQEMKSRTNLQQKDSEGKVWEMSFALPAEYKMETAPKPDNDDVKLVQWPSQVVASKRFSGSHEPKDVAAEEESLKNWVSKSKYVASSRPMLAQYDQPFSIPFLRRNEIQIVVH